MKRYETAMFVLLFAAVVAIGAAFRLSALEKRPLHGDEANQAVKTGRLLETGIYHYDPKEHHGPTLYYMALAALKAAGVKNFSESTITEYRLVPALCGIAMVALAGFLVLPLGRWAAFWAALLTAVSHAMTYYSRYYIQEMLLVLFIYAALACAWRWWRKPGVGWAMGAGACLGLAHATKETCVVIFAAMALAKALTLLYSRWRDGRWPVLFAADTPAAELSARLLGLHGAVLIMAAVLVSVTFFSSFFTYPQGVADSVMAFTTYLHRGTEGTGSAALHDKPWYYYLSLLGWTYRTAGPKWTEAPVLVLAVLGAIVLLWRRGDQTGARPALLGRFLVFLTLVLSVVFSLLAYKTPWNVLVFFQGMILLAGVGAAALIRAGRWRPVQATLCAIVLGVAVFEARQAWQGNFVYAADARNPYAYAHTSTAVTRLVDRVHDLCAVDPDGTAMRVHVIQPGGDYWPLPWYFRDLTKVGYWSDIPPSPDAPVIITAPQLAPKLQPLLKDQYFVETHGLRPGRLLTVFIRQDLWDRFIAGRS
jgi:uncharacterized protein (TIGR03663 family)